MSFSGLNKDYSVDELFLADCTSSRQEKESSGTLYSSAFLRQTMGFNESSGALAYHMLKNLLTRLLYNRNLHHLNTQHQALIKWKFTQNEIHEHPALQKHLNTLFSNFSINRTSTLKRCYSFWTAFTRSKAISTKYSSRKSRREESHNNQVTQITRFLSQLQVRNAETEKQIEVVGAREKKFKEACESSNKITASDNEVNRHSETLKKLERENENLKDRLEAAYNNVNAFMKEMTLALETEEPLFPDDDGMEESHLKSSRRKKLSLVR